MRGPGRHARAVLLAAAAAAAAAVLAGLTVSATAAPLARTAASRQTAAVPRPSITCPGATGGRATGAVETATRSTCPGRVTGAGTATAAGVGQTGTVTVQANPPLADCSAVMCSASFTARVPGGDLLDVAVARHAGDATGTQELTITLPPGVADGEWSVTLTGPDADQTAGFLLDVPPSAPAHVTARPSVGVMSLGWAPSTPGDVDSYRVYDGARPVATVDAAACSARSCAAVVRASVGRHSYVVSAGRPDGRGGEAVSAGSGPAGAVMPAAPTAGARARGLVRSGVTRPPAIGQRPRALSPLSLLPIPGVQAPTAPGARGPAGAAPPTVIAGPAPPVTASAGQAGGAGDRTVPASVGGALLALLAAAHVRRLARRPDPDP